MKILKEYKNICLLSDHDEDDLKYAAELIKSGEIIGIPTETVYGLGGDALNPEAVKKIFAAKGRPADNPLIVHISNIKQIEKLCKNIPDIVYDLAENFWPGPLTMIMDKQSIIPYVTSGGLETVGIRMPNSKFTRDLIDAAGTPIAAPSANISGYPSPTEAEHVCRDMAGKIKAVVDGGKCKVGVESTVIAFDNANTIRILRPGLITKDDLSHFAQNIIIDKAITEGLQNGEVAKSPGMKYKHYSPIANVTLVKGGRKAFEDFTQIHKDDEKTYIVAFDNEDKIDKENIIHYGDTHKEQANKIFSLLRDLDKKGAKQIYIHCPDTDGVGLAVYNRLIRAAAFEVISL